MGWMYDSRVLDGKGSWVPEEEPEALRDARGVPIRVGDVVTYVKTGRYPSIKTAKVVETRKRVKLGSIDELSRKIYHEEDDTAWAESTNLIVVTVLPYAEGRLNT